MPWPLSDLEPSAISSNGGTADFFCWHDTSVFEFCSLGAVGKSFGISEDEDENESDDVLRATIEKSKRVLALQRELLQQFSNASDALDKLRFLSVSEPSLLGDAGELEICIKPDPDNGTITVTDTGIGMTKEELIDCLGTIAQSGTSRFLKALKENKDLGI